MSLVVNLPTQWGSASNCCNISVFILHTPTIKTVGVCQVSSGSKVTILSGNSISCKSAYFGFKYQKCLLSKNEKTKFPKAKGQKSNASTKVPITNDLELPQNAPDAVAVAVEEAAVVDVDASGEKPPTTT